MADFSRLILTGAGQTLLAEVIAGKTRMRFTKIAASETAYTDEQIELLTSLGGVRQETAVTRVTREGESAIRVEAALTNEGLGEGYTFRTLALLAEDSAGRECVYAAAREASGGCYMPPEKGATVSGAYIQLVTTVSSAENVVLDASAGVYATIGDIDALQEQIDEGHVRMDALAEEIAARSEELAAHARESVYSKAGVHGLRYADGCLEVAAPDGAGGTRWQEAAGLGGSVLRITFDEAFRGQLYTVSAEGEAVTGTVPDSLREDVRVKQCGQTYTIRARSALDNVEYAIAVAVGTYYGQYAVHLGAFAAFLRVAAVPGAAVRAVLESGDAQAGVLFTGTANEQGMAEVRIGLAGTYTVTAEKDGARSSAARVEVVKDTTYTAAVRFATLTVSSAAGGTLTLSCGAEKLTRISTGADTFYLPCTGVWTCELVLGEETGSKTIRCAAYEDYALTMDFVHIYGVAWDGTATSKWTRTDDAANFTDPVPYFLGAQAYSSPFDGRMPWSGMTVSERTAGTMVAIPKFWYQLTQEGKGMQLRIASKATEGFRVSPAHMERGDGKGERDIVYVGRYKCTGTSYKSESGYVPKNNITRSAARTAIHKLGTEVWQYDFAMLFTIWMLYLVEFADWDSQKTIGNGCGPGGGSITYEPTGYTNLMPYHTGTMKPSRDTWGAATQYRNIEGLWDNVFEWVDGCYNDTNGLNIILNPSKFADKAGGKCIGKPCEGLDVFPAAFRVSGTADFVLFYGSEVGGSGETYSCDAWRWKSDRPCVKAGGYYNPGGDYGLFAVLFDYLDQSYAGNGCRLMELP